MSAYATSNGNANGSSVVSSTPHLPAEGSKEVKFPETKADLVAMLQRYQRILKAVNDARETHSNFSRLVDSKRDAASPVPPFKDAHADEKAAIEAVFASISEKQTLFQLEKESFNAEVKTALNAASDDPDAQLQAGLLENQIAGLQLLSKDLDLPQNFQRCYEASVAGTSAPKKLTAEQALTEQVEKIMDSLFNPDLSLDEYLDKAKALGIKTPSSVASIDPLYAPLGNYYTERMISSKIASRLRELEDVPANLGTFTVADDVLNAQENYDALKIRALIELKSLNTLSKQKNLKNNILRKVALGAHYDVPELNDLPLTLQGRRGYFLRDKIDQPNPHLLAVQLEERKKQEAKRKEHQLHVSKIRRILDNSSDYLDNKINRANKKLTLLKQITNYHINIEKEESKKLEKTAKQRLQALKANDEEAYMKLLDQTKDHRITHLLKQTNAFLDTLAQAVKVQQEEAGGDVIPTLEGEENGITAEDTVDELREKIDYYQVAHTIKEEVKEQPSILVGGKLKEYQLKGLQWMVSLYNNKLNGILADEMGLGKTIQSISLVTYLIEHKQESKFLVIVPLSTITNWTLEFEKWAPSVKTIVYKGSPMQRRELQNEIRLGSFQVLLTTYEYIIRERPLLCKFNYSHMIIDEGHRLKNATSKLSVTLKSYYRTRNRLILTGTPLQNNLPELWALLNFVLPKVFNSVKSFDEWFNTPFANTGNQEKIELTEEESLLVIRRLHKVLRPFLLRRLKKDVEKDLPDKVEKVLKCNLSGLQYVLYQQMLKHNALFVGAGTTAGKSGIKGLNNKIMQLRKICNHPFVFEEVEDILNSSRLTNDLIWRTSGKFELLDRILPKFKATGHRVLMFFQMTQVMNIMEDFLRYREMAYLRLDGSTKAEDRQDMLKDFNAPDSEYFCFLLSTRAGGLGLNLQTADTVIIFDTDWNPHQDLQAQDRAHRIGQKNEVRILRLISNDSVEEVILERAHQKLDIDGKVIQAGKFDNKSTAEEQEEYLKRLLEAEASKEENEENEQLDDEELNEVLARSEEEKELFNKLDIERNAHQKVNSRLGGFKSRLLDKAELPAIFTEDISQHFEKDTKELTRMREKKRVKYDDGLTEEQWLNAMDDDNDTVEDAIRRKEERRAKRRRRGTAANGQGLSEDDEDDEDDDDDDGYRKRSRRSVSATPQTNGYGSDDFADEATGGDDALTRKFQAVIGQITALQTDGEEPHGVADAFLVLPSRKLYPDYYQVIKKPVSINQIKKKVEQEAYDSLESFLGDWREMVENAKTYNEQGSWIYEDAAAIEAVLAQVAE